MPDADTCDYSYIPGPARELFRHLSRELTRLHSTFDLHQEFYGNVENHRLLFDMVNHASAVIGMSLSRDMVMTIGRLSDPPGAGDRKNVSLTALVDACGDDVPGLKGKYEAFKAASAEALFLRNKVIGHNDLKTLIEGGPALRLQADKIRAGIETAESVLEAVGKHYSGGNVTETFKLLFVIGGADELLGALRVVRDQRTRQLEEWKSWGRVIDEAGDAPPSPQ